MASTYSPKLRFELIGAGEQAGLWGSTTNKNIGQLIEQAIAGVTTVELDGISGNYTLTAIDGAPDQSRSAVIKCTYAAAPASGAINLIIPTQTKLYVVRNDCGQTITVKTSAQVGGVQILNGESTLVFCDGSIAEAGIETATVGTLTVSGGGTGVSTFGAGGIVKSAGGTAALTASAVDLNSTDTTGTLPVSKGGTGTTSFTAGRLLVGNGTNQFAVLAGTVNGQVATWNSTLSEWVAQTPTSTGITSVTASSPIASSGGTTPNISLTGTVPVANGGTGQTGTPTNGQLLIGNGSGFTRATLTAGTGVSITNGSGSITISTSGGSGVTSVTASSPLSSSGGSTPDISFTGTLAIGNGGTGATSASSARTNLGLGTMATQNATSVNITGGSISGVTISPPNNYDYIIMWASIAGGSGAALGGSNVSSSSKLGTGSYQINSSITLPVTVGIGAIPTRTSGPYFMGAGSDTASVIIDTKSTAGTAADAAFWVIVTGNT